MKINTARDDDWTTARAFAAARGVQCALTWAQLEPQDGVYDFSAIDAFVKRAAPKTVLLRYGSSGPGAVPPWFLALPGAQRISAAGEEDRPVFWDPIYLARQERLIAALGARFKGHRSLMWRICGWSDSSQEAGAYNGLNILPEYKAAYLAAGIFTPVGSSKPVFTGLDPYSAAVLRLMRAWRAALPYSRLWLTLHFPGIDGTTIGLDTAMVELGIALKMVLGNTGINCGDKSGARTTFNAWRAAGVQVGWFDVAPAHVPGPCPDLTIDQAWEKMLREAVGSATLPPEVALSYFVTGADSIKTYGAQFAAFAPLLVP